MRTPLHTPRHTPLPPTPLLLPMTQVHCQVGTLVSPGAGPHGERRDIPLGGGTVQGPELNGTLVAGGVAGRSTAPMACWTAPRTT